MHLEHPACALLFFVILLNEGCTLLYQTYTPLFPLFALVIQGHQERGVVPATV